MPAMGKMDRARVRLRQLAQHTAEDEWVTSVADFSFRAGGLSTGATVRVLGEAVAAGWLRSTRGPEGGYWRTDAPVPAEHAEAPTGSVLAQQLEYVGQALRATQDALAGAQSQIIDYPTDPIPPGLVDIDVPRAGEYEPCGIADLAQHSVVPLFATERDFLMNSSQRRAARLLLSGLHDAPEDPAEWVLKHCPATREVYAYRDAPPAGAVHDRRHPEGGGDDLHGPCWLLGTVYDERVLSTAVDRIALVGMPGGIAWVHGRLQILNAVIHQLVMSDGTLAELGENLADYDEGAR